MEFLLKFWQSPEPSCEGRGGNAETSQWVCKHLYQLVLLQLTAAKLCPDLHSSKPLMSHMKAGWALGDDCACCPFTVGEAELCSLACFNSNPTALLLGLEPRKEKQMLKKPRREMCHKLQVWRTGSWQSIPKDTEPWKQGPGDFRFNFPNACNEIFPGIFFF